MSGGAYVRSPSSLADTTRSIPVKHDGKDERADGLQKLFLYAICDFENAIICGKICDMWIFAKYAIAYAIICSHITGIPKKHRYQLALVTLI